jgi:hypothetical protein
MASFSSVKPLSAAQLWDLLALNRVVVWGQRRSELQKQCLLTTRVRLDCDLNLVWGQNWFWSNLYFKRVSSVSMPSVLGVVFSLKRRIALFFTGESWMGFSPLFLRMSFYNVWMYVCVYRCVFNAIIFVLFSLPACDYSKTCEMHICKLRWGHLWSRDPSFLQVPRLYLTGFIVFFCLNVQ